MARTQLADAERLIGDLLEALKWAIAFCPTVGDVRANAHTKEYAEAYRRARNAIEKADA